MLKCPYCGSARLQTAGGENGNPSDRRPQKTLCLDCGRTLTGSDSSDDELLKEAIEEMNAAKDNKPVVVIAMTASAAGITRTATVELPYEDGNYPLGDYDYPISRFSRIIIDGDRLDLDGEISKLTNNMLETEKHFIDYDLNKCGWDETVKIIIYIKQSEEREQCDLKEKTTAPEDTMSL